jgi:putative ABC transport system permease protein
MHHLRLAVRMLGKQPGFTVIAVLTLALGVGANTAIFSVVNAVLLRPLPFPDPDQLVALSSYDDRVGFTGDVDSVSYPNFADWRDQNRVFSHVAVYGNNSLTLTDGQEASHVQSISVSADLFPLLSVQPQLGRIFTAKEDEPGTRVAILSHALWQRRFGSDPSILHRTVTLNGFPYQVIGVMPPGFEFPIQPEPIEIWTTVAGFREKQAGSQAMTEERGNNFLFAFARMKPGVRVERAQANLDLIAGSLAKQYSDSNAHSFVKVVPLLHAWVGHFRPALLMILASAGCVLLVACVNVANLLLARSIGRQKEIGIRSALGAQRSDIIRQLLTESLLLGLVGGLVGLLIAVWGVESLVRLLPANLPRASEISPDGRVLAFTIIISLVVGCLSGLMPAWRASHPNLAASLNESGRGSSESGRGLRLRGFLVVVEIVFALALLSGAGLLAQSFLRLREVKPGFDAHNVMTARVDVPDKNYGKPAEAAEFYRKLLERVSMLPGVTAASAAWWLPLSGNEITFDVQDPQHPMPEAQRPVSQMNAVAPDYFQVLHIPLVKGRTFTVRDDINAPRVMVVNETFARQFFPGQDPIGKRLIPSGSVEPGDPPLREIIGVVGDAKALTLMAKAKPQIYIPHQQFAVQRMSLLIRTQNDPRGILPALRNSVAEVDKDVPLFRPRPLEEFVARSVAQPRFNALLVGLFSTVALLLSVAGIFGVMSYSVSQRTQEIGIRLALGAQRSDVLRLIVGQGMRLVVLGVGTGLLVTFGLTRLLQDLLYGISATDLSTLFMVSSLLSLVAFLACWLPARRASAIDPMVALREG